MTHRPYTLPQWQAAAARDGRVSLLVVPLKPQPKFEYRSWETNLPFAPGDLIWCREDWCDTEDYGLMYKSSSGFVFNWCSPVTMPKWAARTWFRVTGVEVRRVQTISEDGAKRNGAASRPNCYGCLKKEDGWSMDWSRVGTLSRWAMKPPDSPKLTKLKESDIALGDPRMAFASQFNETRGDYAWDANPWAAFVSVEPISKPEGV